MSDIRTITIGLDYEANIASPCLYFSGQSLHLGTFGPVVTYISASITSGIPPPGMTPYVCPGASSALYMVGVPFAAGVYTYTVDALLSNGSHTTVDCIHTVALVPGCPLITPSEAWPALNGKIGIAFSQTITATGGVAPYTWDAIGTLPPGLAFSSGGVLSGTPTGGVGGGPARGGGGPPPPPRRQAPIRRSLFARPTRTGVRAASLM
jgi:hypothetical protein